MGNVSATIRIVLMILSMLAAFVYAVYYLQIPDSYIPVEHEIIKIIGTEIVRFVENLASFVAGCALCMYKRDFMEDKT